MSREWKPGDVAMIDVGCHANRHRAWFGGGGWYYGDDVQWVQNDPAIVTAHPLVVIDPEDREAVARLGELIRDQHQNNVFATDDVQAALREFANPTPPLPDEPQGLGAVVEDAYGTRWTRVESGEAETRNPWYPSVDPDMQPDEWERIKVVRVLSGGVTA